MRNLSRLLIISVVIFAALFSAAPFSMAQDLGDQPPTAAELEQFRSDLAEMLTSLDASVRKMKQNPLVSKTTSKSGKDMTQSVGAAQKQLEKLTYQELEQIHHAFRTTFPKWRDAAGLMERLAEKIGGNYSAGKDDINTSNAITPDNCQDAFNAAPSFTDYAATKAAAIVADGAQNVIPPPLNIIATAAYVALEEGALAAETLNSIFDRCSGDEALNTLQSSVTNVQNSVNNSQTTVLNAVSSATTNLTNAITSSKTDILNNATTNTTNITTAVSNAKTDIVNNDNTNKTTIVTAISQAQTAVITAGDANSAAIINNDNSNKTMIVNNDNSNALTLNTNLTNAKNTIVANDNTNTTNIVNNDNANKTMIINNSNANTMALNDLILRAHIEADLATESNSVKVAWYMTPTANGGHLDLVQAIVTQTLANILAAGGSINNAQMFLDRANADKAAGNFKSAYDNYRKAYKAAAN